MQDMCCCSDIFGGGKVAIFRDVFGMVIAVLLAILPIFLCINVSRRFMGRGGVKKYIIGALCFQAAFIFIAVAVSRFRNELGVYFVIAGYLGALYIIYRAFKAAKKINQEYSDDLIKQHNDNSYTALYTKCSSCGNDCVPGAMICSECGVYLSE
jgi:threonine/homoserine/homoserine lactone efflux protein